MARAESFLPDCVVLDITMPGMDGYEVAMQVRLKPALSSVKIVALTANHGVEHLRRVREAGFDYHLSKPADPDDVERLFRMLAQSMKLAESTRSLAEKNIELAKETKELLVEVKEELQEVKEELKEVKEEIRHVSRDK